MGITNSNKELSTSQIDCSSSFRVRLSLTAAPDITSNPTDIVLILDRSGSMAGSPFANMKNGAKAFIDIIDEATDNSQDGQIGSGSRIGIVSFSDVAVQNTQLITSVADLKNAINGLSSGGSTNHQDAFTKALDLFDPNSSNAKVMVMFTDGVTTAGGNPNTVATAAKAQGVTIYCIGLSGNGGIDEQALRDWASDPDSSYVAITPDDAELEEIFKDLAKNISKPGATNITVTDTVSPCFRVTALFTPTKGTTRMIDANTVEWKIDELGVSQSEGAVFEFEVEHTGDCSGTVEVNESITYNDNEGNVVAFPSPSIEIDCGVVVCAENYRDPVDITVDGCTDTIEFDAGNIYMEGLGRIIQLDVTLKNICPQRRVALAVFLQEVDANGTEHKRGVKMMTVPAHTRDSCHDVVIRCITFVLPEDIDVSDTTGCICNTRNFNAKIIAHYIDNNYNCCCCDEEG